MELNENSIIKKDGREFIIIGIGDIKIDGEEINHVWVADIQTGKATEYDVSEISESEVETHNEEYVSLLKEKVDILQTINGCGEDIEIGGGFAPFPGTFEADDYNDTLELLCNKEKELEIVNSILNIQEAAAQEAIKFNRGRSR